MSNSFNDSLQGIIIGRGQVIGKSSSGSLQGTIIGRESLKGGVTIGTVIGATEYPVYDGELSIVPSATEEQTLPTANKLLNEDITIKKIPYAEVTNSANGTTITIA